MTEMKPQLPSDFRLTDPAAFLRNMGRAIEKTGEIVTALSENREGQTEVAPGSAQQFEAAIRALGEIFQAYLKHPDKLIDAQFELWRMHARLWDAAWKRFLSAPVGAGGAPRPATSASSTPTGAEPGLRFLKQSIC
jgi:hypothetical protein